MAEESVSEQEVQESRIALEMATKSLVALDQAAHGYAKLPAAVKPSWAGIILIALSITLELIYSSASGFKSFQLSDGFTILMFVSGLVSLLLGALLEAVSYIIQLREASSDKDAALQALEAAANKNKGVWSKITG